MKEVIRKINSRNQVTIPQIMMKILKTKPGDYVKVRLDEDKKCVEIIGLRIVD